jgi:hypothetical protein
MQRHPCHQVIVELTNLGLHTVASSCTVGLHTELSDSIHYYINVEFLFALTSLANGLEFDVECTVVA